MCITDLSYDAGKKCQRTISFNATTDRMMTLRNNRIVSLVIQGVHYNDYNIIVTFGEKTRTF